MAASLTVSAALAQPVVARAAQQSRSVKVRLVGRTVSTMRLAAAPLLVGLSCFCPPCACRPPAACPSPPPCPAAAPVASLAPRSAAGLRAWPPAAPPWRPRPRWAGEDVPLCQHAQLEGWSPQQQIASSGVRHAVVSSSLGAGICRRPWADLCPLPRGLPLLTHSLPACPAPTSLHPRGRWVTLWRSSCWRPPPTPSCASCS